MQQHLTLHTHTFMLQRRLRRLAVVREYDWNAHVFSVAGARQPSHQTLGVALDPSEGRVPVRAAGDAQSGGHSVCQKLDEEGAIELIEELDE